MVAASRREDAGLGADVAEDWETMITCKMASLLMNGRLAREEAAELLAKLTSGTWTETPTDRDSDLLTNWLHAGPYPPHSKSRVAAHTGTVRLASCCRALFLAVRWPARVVDERHGP